MGVTFAFRTQFTDAPRFYAAAEQLLTGNKTTIKIETHCVKKIYFNSLFHENVRKISQLEKPTALDQLVELMVADLLAGRAIVAEKREDGKLMLFVTKEVKNELESKKRTLSGKNGKIKEIASIQVVGLDFFTSLVKSLLQNPAENKKTTSTERRAVTAVQAMPSEKKRAQKPLLTIWKDLAKHCFNAIFDLKIQELEAGVSEEESRIIDRLYKKNQESIEEAAELLRAEIKRMLLKEEVVKTQIKTVARKASAL
jgi:hypothetical protein